MTRRVWGGDKVGILELKGRDLRNCGVRDWGEKWNFRRERDGWPDEEKEELEGVKMVRDSE